jgi:hypothetical protein
MQGYLNFKAYAESDGMIGLPAGMHGSPSKFPRPQRPDQFDNRQRSGDANQYDLSSTAAI